MNSTPTEKTITDMRCPLCQLPLLSSEKTWHCDNRHSFDVAKQGYANLLPVQNKRSKTPGDDAIMVSSRHFFLNKNYYQPISNTITQLMVDYFSKQNIDHPNILDAGCGEGYYTNEIYHTLNENHSTSTVTGIDISKPAVLTAAKRNKFIRWFVSSSSNLPLANNSQHCILSLFSPVPAEEFHRCLSKDGLLIVASTGEDHLIELRNILYEEVHKKTFDPAHAVGTYFQPTQTDGSDKNHVKTVKFTLELTDCETITSLFAMTPHYWRVSPERKKILETVDQLSVTVEIQLHLFSSIQKTDAAG